MRVTYVLRDVVKSLRQELGDSDQNNYSQTRSVQQAVAHP